MQVTAKNKKVKIVDCSEFNPAVESYVSSRVIGELFYALAMGLADRKGE